MGRISVKSVVCIQLYTLKCFAQLVLQCKPINIETVQTANIIIPKNIYHGFIFSFNQLHSVVVVIFAASPSPIYIIPNVQAAFKVQVLCCIH
mgnify:CR=1 FL=1